MQSHHHRYFIELQLESPAPTQRNLETEARREQAASFIATIYDWLKSQDLDDMVSEMDVTAFGQIQITCDTEIINRIRQDSAPSIAAIRPGALYVEGIGQIGRRG